MSRISIPVSQKHCNRPPPLFIPICLQSFRQPASQFSTHNIPACLFRACPSYFLVFPLRTVGRKGSNLLLYSFCLSLALHPRCLLLSSTGTWGLASQCVGLEIICPLLNSALWSVCWQGLPAATKVRKTLKTRKNHPSNLLPILSKMVFPNLPQKIVNNTEKSRKL